MHERARARALQHSGREQPCLGSLLSALQDQQSPLQFFLEQAAEVFEMECITEERVGGGWWFQSNYVSV